MKGNSRSKENGPNQPQALLTLRGEYWDLE
jgi:hypothetical protein